MRHQCLSAESLVRTPAWLGRLASTARHQCLSAESLVRTECLSEFDRIRQDVTNAFRLRVWLGHGRKLVVKIPLLRSPMPFG